MICIIAGCRDFTDYDRLCDALSNIFQYKFPDAVVCGLAAGADSLGKEWAIEHGVEVLEFPAEWDRYGKSAGYRRNEQMADAATHLVAFWDGQSRGTRHMINLAKSKGLEIRVHKI